MPIICAKMPISMLCYPIFAAHKELRICGTSSFVILRCNGGGGTKFH